MNRCCGKTNSGFRCTRKGKYSKYYYYGAEIPVCKQHQNKNVIYDWSNGDTNNETIPECVFDFLTLYGRCLATFNLDSTISLFISSKLFTYEGHENKKLNELLEILFKETKNISECPICYEDKKLVELNCSHGFCKKCIIDWAFTCDSVINCPICREKL